MIKYAIKDGSKCFLQKNDKYLSVIVKEHLHTEYLLTGIFLWPDDGTIIVVEHSWATVDSNPQISFITNKTQLGLYFAAGVPKDAEIARLYPLAASYHGSIELERISTEWFNM